MPARSDIDGMTGRGPWWYVENETRPWLGVRMGPELEYREQWGDCQFLVVVVVHGDSK